METPKKLNSSAVKCSTPTIKNVSYRETFHFGSETLHRSFSYNELWSPGENGKGTAITQVTVSCCKTPNKAIKPNKRKKLSYDNIPRKKLKIIEESKSKFTVIMFMTIGVIGAVLLGLNVMRCGDKDLKPGFQLKLSSSIYGQHEAIDSIFQTLKEAKYESDVNKKHTLMALIGPMGVGKSYAVSIIEEYFPNQNSISFTTANEVIKKKSLPFKISACWSLKIIEDCRADQIDEMLNILNDYSSSPETLVILVITSNERWKNNKLLPNMVQKKIYFNRLATDTIEKCFMSELQKYPFQLNKHEITKLVYDHIKPINEGKWSPGCKSVKEKIIKHFAAMGYVP